MMMIKKTLLCSLSIFGTSQALVANAPKTIVSSKVSQSPMFEYLKFGGTTPDFDVVDKTKKYVENNNEYRLDEFLYDKDYVLRGPVIGPITRKDTMETQKGLGVRAAFPDAVIETFGYTVDPENPYRCFYFQRWRATHTEDMDVFGDVFPATNKVCETPVSVFSVVWTPEGKIIYEQVGAVVDRFEGNTQGKAAVFGLLHTAGLKLNAQPGNASFSIIQRLGHFFGGRGRSWSKEEDIPSWWKSESKGADSTDQF
mmetsp:Transcript_21396/g.32722  ORF Transcript_21396/g.32722 Transcript_21396/m.32722 type:complete len:255 (+) Transcript_21396:540-1304(+)|eukprot:CAMPEP_0118686214 /NCGR_PEP_ID=MMETSP0800-20121206/7687_1 /TAXON_ID=210618 ORGANISM="Striatella unipunctata, Strain CCMP2910" /NCGR_SAMPLE_ID=MMETSP0800 /ASSEMBLY_ACC=CAM_ASM_000638 /LENGTH=254 /DNA_ID=CAMNT_0006583231 /DNA_START=76 /DNA_END=840 /DNA_ORIENTATION=-